MTKQTTIVVIGSSRVKIFSYIGFPAVLCEQIMAKSGPILQNDRCDYFPSKVLIFFLFLQENILWVLIRGALFLWRN